MNHVSRTAALLAAVLTCTTACTSGSPRASASAEGGTPRIQLISTPDGTGVIEVTGIAERDLNELRQREPADNAWTALLRVSVAATDSPAGEDPLPMVGAYAVTDSGIRFRPRFGLDPGRPYDVVFDPARLPATGGATANGGDSARIRATVSTPAEAPAPPTRVVEIYPTTPELPENQLRLYISFSAPMSVTRAIDHITLLDETGQPVEAPFLPVDVALWNADRTRFTVLFDPGRVKTGILPNERMGRALIRGRTYTLVVDAAWRDAKGQPLASEHRRTFKAGPADTRPIDPHAWRLDAPLAGSREPLVATFPEPLDHALLHRALVVSTADGGQVEGSVSVDAGETRWRFTPASAWRTGDYQLTALPILEDGSGNQIGRAFEVDARASGEGDDEPQAISLRFRVKSTH
jgi:hypothetical protein